MSTSAGRRDDLKWGPTATSGRALRASRRRPHLNGLVDGRRTRVVVPTTAALIFAPHRAQSTPHAPAVPLEAHAREVEVAAHLPAHHDERDQHTAEVSGVADVLASAHRDSQHEQQRNEPDCLHGHRREQQHDGAVGPGE